MDIETCLLGVGICATSFGALALFMGYDTIVLNGVFSLLGLLAGFIVGRKTQA